MRSIQIVALATALVIAGTGSILGGCGRAADQLAIVSYNVQNLFDDQLDGGEYSEFRPENGWDDEQFHAKMKRISEALRLSGDNGSLPDVAVLHEVENRAALVKLNELYLDRAYRNVLHLSRPGDAVQSAVLSRLPIVALHSHSLSVMGAALALVLEVGMEWRDTPLWIISAHWKSKRGGAASSERLRRAEAALVARLVAARLQEESAADIVVLGDLNESVDEYERIGGKYATALMPIEAGPCVPGCLRVTTRLPTARSGQSTQSASGEPLLHEPVLYSPWGQSDAAGSYYFDGWETIDHFLLSSGLFDEAGFVFAGFAVIDDTRLLDADGRPRRFDRGFGYSDHLPILLRLERHN